MIKTKMKLITTMSLVMFLGISVKAISNASVEPVIAKGVVPDIATKQQIIQKLKAVYGETRVQDEIEVKPTVRMPPEWLSVVDQAISPDMKKISKGRVEINGPLISIFGKISADNDPTVVADGMFSGIKDIYQVTNSLEVQVAQQKVIDDTLANRIVEFNPASAELTPLGLGILDEMAQALKNVGGNKVEIIGHTDSVGRVDENQRLSEQRANAVKEYLTGRNIAPERMLTKGMGADEPIASNATEAGRKRNRRIEFKLIQ